MRSRNPSVAPCLLTALILVLGPLGGTQACQESRGERGLVLDWLRQQILARMGLEEAPVPGVGPEGATGEGEGPVAQRIHRPRVGRAAWSEGWQAPQDSSQVILFPSSDSTCTPSSAPPSPGASSFTYYFQPSTHCLESSLTSAHFWFYSGPGPQTPNTSVPLYVLTAGQQLLQAAPDPESLEEDGWSRYRLGPHVLPSLSQGPFVLQVRCPTCTCSTQAEQTPFLHLHTRPRAPDRARRSSVPWSLSALDRLQRPSKDGGDYHDCHHEELNISFHELGWENWIVHPKVFTFHYCQGNCSSQDRITTLMGIRQCCAPLPGTMKPLRVRTTSDRGYSVKYETLPNINAEDCTCI
ncbi:hypothetical protein COCON_G00197220 [Conger conger]|uniref:Inhibin alpha chain n=1 Tax=Conger conger TaxID=82655 RepID=A0A9Q1HQG5_CONCO|nr:inhibin alpha chain [Conger conger]KAJ8255858.1 hypothetical protein COCON_G00197220 [Conger conger]